RDLNSRPSEDPIHRENPMTLRIRRSIVVQRIDTAYHIRMEDLPSDSRLRMLENVGFDIYALSLLADCKALYDPRKGTWHEVNLNVNNIMDLRFSRLHLYPRFEEAIRTADVDDFDWSNDTWQLSSRIVGKELVWSVISKTTQKAWLNRSFTFLLTPGKSPDEELEAFGQEIKTVVPLSQLSNLDDEFESHSTTLVERSERFQLALDRDIPPYKEMPVFMFKRLEIRREQSHKEIIVILESEEGDIEEVHVVRSVKRFQDDTQYAGSISYERIDTEVNSNLARYGIKEEELTVIRDEIKQTLEEEGVRFHEE
ncbi:MAG: hypothetical protein ACFFET_18345, partial [Candidatus Thorarchaeota archaeon]